MAFLFENLLKTASMKSFFSSMPIVFQEEFQPFLGLFFVLPGYATQSAQITLLESYSQVESRCGKRKGDIAKGMARAQPNRP